MIGDFQPDVVVDNWSKSVANASIAISIAQAVKVKTIISILICLFYLIFMRAVGAAGVHLLRWYVQRQ